MSVTQVLVVDDFQPWRRIVRVMLESKNNLNVVAEAVDGLDAIQNAQQLQPDLVVLDVGLPITNGIETARRIRQLSPNSRILFLSNEASIEVVEAALRVGAQGYLLKPHAASELLLAVDAILRNQRFVGSRLRSPTIAGDEPRPDRAQNHGELQSSRAMDWEIGPQKVVYGCTHCAWELVVEVGTCPEPFRLFEQHVCAITFTRVVSTKLHPTETTPVFWMAWPVLSTPG